MQILIEALTFDVIIGVLDFERERPQRVVIDLVATYDYQENLYIDYAGIVNLVKETMHTQRFELLEEALLFLKDILHKKFPKIRSLSLKIAKPDILSECTVSLSEQWHFHA
jgi:dihydroneopterin aldolase